MSKLETLEDIPYFIKEIHRKYPKEYIEFQHLVDKKDLRQLGIKWIKAFEKGECWTDFAADQRKGQENIIEWIEHVFNITEEDLKEKKKDGK